MKAPVLLAVVTALLLAAPDPRSGRAAPAQPVPATPAIPYVPTRHDTVKDLLWLADVGTQDVVYDLGSGDGRVAIAAVRDFGARRAVGIELDEKLVGQSRSNAAQAGLAGRVEFIHGDLFTNDVSAASVVVLYLGHGANLDLRAPLLSTLKPGARVVSHQFNMGEWAADRTLIVRSGHLGMYSEMINRFATNADVPDFNGQPSRRTHNTLSMWTVPAPMAGVWRGQVPDDWGGGELRVTLSQRFSELTGAFQWQGSTNLAGGLQTDLSGDQVRLHCYPTNGYFGSALLWFEGTASDDTLHGKLFLWRKEGTREAAWTAQRARTDYAGVWEWAGPLDSPVQLKVERRDGKFAVSYEDRHRDVPRYSKERGPLPVRDFYDFGGGFYFTLLLGSEGEPLRKGARRLGPEDGWVIGQATMNGDELAGTIAFHPYPRDPAMESFRNKAFESFKIKTPSPQPVEVRKPPRAGRQDWKPRRVPGVP